VRLLECAPDCDGDAADAHQPRDHSHPSRNLGVVLEQSPAIKQEESDAFYCYCSATIPSLLTTQAQARADRTGH
jgi:hypothetical protein